VASWLRNDEVIPGIIARSFLGSLGKLSAS
jgi:hypothetical protein